jgi:hypothetical protein
MVSRIENFYCCENCGAPHISDSFCSFDETVYTDSVWGLMLVPAECPECSARESLTLVVQRELTDDEYQDRREYAYNRGLI